VNYAGNAAKAEEAVAEIAAAGGRGIAVQADVANATDVDRLFKEAVDTFGTIDVVVNCAGIMPLRPIAGGDLEVFDKVIATNLRGAFVVLGQAARQVSPGGRIIAFSTSVIAKAFPTYGPYIPLSAGQAPDFCPAPGCDNRPLRLSARRERFSRRRSKLRRRRHSAAASR
jgi:3-oxoacyl-[acyl-carrier protein] reductase